jgi:hypothetical protein
MEKQSKDAVDSAELVWLTEDGAWCDESNIGKL